MTRELLTSTPRLLVILRDHWPHISQQLSTDGLHELSQITVTCTDRMQRTLAGTALRRRSLSSLPNEALHFVEVFKADDQGWDFLQELGVMVEPNVTAWLEVLKQLRGSEGHADVKSVKEIYKQLDARFNEAPEIIR